MPTQPNDQPQAWSVDGSTFTYTAPVQAPLPLGAFVVIGDDERKILGQILERQPAQSSGSEAGRQVRGIGRLLSASTDGGFDTPTSLGFAPAPVRAAGAAEIREAAVLAEGPGAFPVGTLEVGGDVASAMLRASGFTRHTFLCGQSGSGKTYATGTILERLVAETALRMVVIDPNGDYRRLTSPRTDGEQARRLVAADPKVTIHSSGTAAGPPRLRIGDLSPAGQMALLRLDPIQDRGELSDFLNLMARRAAGEGPGVLLERLADPDNDEPLAIRARALGLHRWSSWALDQPSVVDALSAPDEVHVVDVSSTEAPTEMYAIAAAILDHLWERREDRVPTLIAVDEAHNLCTSEPGDPLQAHLTDRLVQIAGEGRKFGLHLLLATQRPAKLHPNVMSQCDNLVLLRMNSPADLEEIHDLFGFAPRGLIARATAFAQGEALVAGPISPVPQLLRFGDRISEEGGSDIPVDWTHPRV